MILTLPPSACNTAPPMASDWHRLDPKFMVRFALTDQGVDTDWKPRHPNAAELSRCMKRYRRARDAFLTALGERLGRSVIVLEA